MFRNFFNLLVISANAYLFLTLLGFFSNCVFKKVKHAVLTSAIIQAIAVQYFYVELISKYTIKVQSIFGTPINKGGWFWAFAWHRHYIASAPSVGNQVYLHCLTNEFPNRDIEAITLRAHKSFSPSDLKSEEASAQYLLNPDVTLDTIYNSCALFTGMDYYTDIKAIRSSVHLIYSGDFDTYAADFLLMYQNWISGQDSKQRKLMWKNSLENLFLITNNVLKMNFYHDSKYSTHAKRMRYRVYFLPQLNNTERLSLYNFVSKRTRLVRVVDSLKKFTWDLFVRHHYKSLELNYKVFKMRLSELKFYTTPTKRKYKYFWEGWVNPSFEIFVFCKILSVILITIGVLIVLLLFVSANYKYFDIMKLVQEYTNNINTSYDVRLLPWFNLTKIKKNVKDILISRKDLPQIFPEMDTPQLDKFKEKVAKPLFKMSILLWQEFRYYLREAIFYGLELIIEIINIGISECRGIFNRWVKFPADFIIDKTKKMYQEYQDKKK